MEPSPHAATMAATPPPTLHIVLFSKDRAFQLRECLRSVRRHVRGRVLVSVLYDASSPASERAYDYVVDTLASDCVCGSVPHGALPDECRIAFHREASFAADLHGLLASSAAPCVAFLVDDALFLRDVSVDDVHGLLAGGQRVSAYFPKLHPGVSFSHPAQRRCWPPRLDYVPLSSDQEEADVGRGAALWAVNEAVGDWTYLWDFCGTVYSAAWAVDVAGRVLDRLAAAGARACPNLVEADGNALLVRARVA